MLNILENINKLSYCSQLAFLRKYPFKKRLWKLNLFLEKKNEYTFIWFNFTQLDQSFYTFSFYFSLTINLEIINSRHNLLKVIFFWCGNKSSCDHTTDFYLGKSYIPTW